MTISISPVAAASIRNRKSNSWSNAWFWFWHNLTAIWCVALVPHTAAFLLSLVSIAKGKSPGNLIDFLGAAHDMLLGRDIYSGGTGGYVYPPLIAFLYQPLAMLPLRSAAVISLIFNATLSVVTLFVVSRVLVKRILGNADALLSAQVALFGAVCTADKIKGEFAHVETNVFMLIAFTAAMRWVDKRPWLCGLALGLAFNIKYLPLVLIPYLAIRHRWKAIGWFVLWAVVFAMIPALSMGFKANLHAWAEASAGIARLFGVKMVTDHAAHVRSITAPVSISLTSGLARMTHWSAPQSIALAGVMVAAFGLFALLIYRRNGTPLFRWPTVSAQTQPPFCGLFTIEWMIMLMLTLTFSPFTNSRHLYMLLDVNIAAGVLLLGTRGLASRAPLLIAVILLALGITFPPGGIAVFDNADQFWRKIGGPGWSMLVLCVAMLWTNANYQQAALDSLRLRTPDIA